MKISEGEMTRAGLQTQPRSLEDRKRDSIAKKTSLTVNRIESDKGLKMEKGSSRKYDYLFGTLDVRKTLETHREKRASYLASGVLPVQEDDVISKREKFDWEIDPKKLIIKNFIAKGTYGTVHRGIFDGKDVAVKLLDWGEDSMSRAELSVLRNAFKQEVTVWSTLNHPNVTQFYGGILGGAEGFTLPSTAVGHHGQMLVDGHVCCVVLEYQPGGSLKDLLIQHIHKKLPFKSVIHLVLDVARGLMYLHSKHIVHRDVKSDNMLLDKHKRVKIADFGVSRVESDKGKEKLPMAGTFGYMAPEVLKGIPYDHKVDVYSFGILLWETYCCDNPFPFMDFNVNDIKAFVGQGLRPEIPSCCPPVLANLMTSCWDQNPDKRPDMDEVVKILEGVDVHKGKGMLREPEMVKPTSCFCFGR